MATMVKEASPASVRADFRWWIMVIVLLVGAGVLLFLPSVLLAASVTLPLAAVSIAVALVTWIGQGSWYRRASSGLFVLAGMGLLIVSLTRSSSLANSTPSAWPTIAACLLMGLALVMGLLAALERRSGRAPSSPLPEPLSAPLFMSAMPAEIASPAAAAVEEISPPPAVDPVPEMLERVIGRYKASLARSTGGLLPVDLVIGRLRAQLQAALGQVQGRAREGHPAAQSALDQAARSGELDGVQAVLASWADSRADGAQDLSGPASDLNRQLAAVALLSGRADEAHARLRQVLSACPDDPMAIDHLALAAELQGQVEEAEQLYSRLLDCTSDPLVQANAHGSLGLICQTREQLDRAEQMHRKALELDERLGRLEGVAHQLGQLGAVCEMRGETAQAETMYRRALEVHERLGRLEEMANQYINLGLLASQRDEVGPARDLWTQARDLFTRAGMSGNAHLVQQLLDELPPQ